MSSLSEFTYVSTFAGCGGSSLGYKWAGGRGLCAVEFDANAAETYRLNFPETPVLERDIATVTAQEVLDVAGIGMGDLDVLDGSPPCQGFSMAGKRQLTDPRNSLFREYVRLIEGLQPRVFVMENVSGLVKGKMKFAFREIMLALNATGYRVRCQLLNAMYYHVPQSRERLIWIGVRPDIGVTPTHPRAQGKPIPMEVVCPHLQGARINWCQFAGQALDGSRPWHSSQEPSPTIPKGGKRAVLDNGRVREFTPEECAALSTFPVSFVWVGNLAQRIARIGNSVPPRFAQAIAEHVRDTILFPAKEVLPHA